MFFPFEIRDIEALSGECELSSGKKAHEFLAPYVQGAKTKNSQSCDSSL